MKVINAFVPLKTFCRLTKLTLDQIEDQFKDGTIRLWGKTVSQEYILMHNTKSKQTPINLGTQKYIELLNKNINILGDKDPQNIDHLFAQGSLHLLFGSANNLNCYITPNLDNGSRTQNIRLYLEDVNSDTKTIGNDIFVNYHCLPKQYQETIHKHVEVDIDSKPTLHMFLRHIPDIIPCTLLAKLDNINKQQLKQTKKINEAIKTILSYLEILFNIDLTKIPFTIMEFYNLCKEFSYYFPNLIPACKATFYQDYTRGKYNNNIPLCSGFPKQGNNKSEALANRAKEILLLPTRYRLKKNIIKLLQTFS